MEKRRDAGTSCLDANTKAERSNIYAARNTYAQAKWGVFRGS
jgi:hypothetical protein